MLSLLLGFLFLFNLLEVLYSLIVVSSNFVFVKKFIELPKLKSCHLLPANFRRLRVYDATLALVLSEFEMVDQARPRTRSDSRLASYKVLVYQFVRVLPGVPHFLQVTRYNIARVLLLPHDFLHHVELQGIRHQANDVAGGRVVGFLLEAVWVHEVAGLEPQFLRLLVHFLQECLEVVVLSPRWLLERPLDYILNIFGQIRKVVNLALLAQLRQ